MKFHLKESVSTKGNCVVCVGHFSDYVMRKIFKKSVKPSYFCNVK